MRYDAESNIISWELSDSPISHARAFGQFIVHFSRNEKPVLIEILDADKFAKQFEKIKDMATTEEATPVS